MTLKDNKKEIALLGVGLLLVLLSIYGIYAQYGNMGAARETLEEEEMKLGQAEDRLSTLMALKEQEEEFEERLAFLKEALPEVPGESALMHTILTAADRRGNIEDVRISTPSDQEDFSEIPLTFSYSGRYRGLVEFLDNLQRDRRIVRIDSITVSEGRDGFPSIRADITASSFYNE